MDTNDEGRQASRDMQDQLIGWKLPDEAYGRVDMDKVLALVASLQQLLTSGEITADETAVLGLGLVYNGIHHDWLERVDSLVD